MKLLCFRFDVDTHKCIRDGVPNLLQLAQLHKVNFTFFLNVGQAIDRPHIFQGKLKDKREADIKSFSSFTKLGIKDYIFLALVNPLIGDAYVENIKKIFDFGHEVGLHGGRNHQSWFANAKNWPSKKIKEELVWAIEVLMKIDSRRPVGFASPGWNGSVRINRILRQLGFQYVADIHSDQAVEEMIYSNGIIQIPTNIAGEPGGVGYLEYCRVSRMNDSEILEDFKGKLIKRKRLAIIYDHPFYAGVKELNILGKMIEMAKSMNIKIITIQEALNKK